MKKIIVLILLSILVCGCRNGTGNHNEASAMETTSMDQYIKSMNDVDAEVFKVMNGDDFQKKGIRERKQDIDTLLKGIEGKGIVKDSVKYDERSYTFYFKYDGDIPGKIIIYDDTKPGNK